MNKYEQNLTRKLDLTPTQVKQVVEDGILPSAKKTKQLTAEECARIEVNIRGDIADFMTKLPEFIYAGLRDGDETIVTRVCSDVNLATGVHKDIVRGHIYSVLESTGTPFTPVDLKLALSEYRHLVARV